MKPYYQDDYATIYHGDCREILPTLPKVDLIFTSPPYNVGLKYISYNDDMPDDKFEEFCKEISLLLFEMANESARYYSVVSDKMLWHYKESAEVSGWKYCQKLTWCKPNLAGGARIGGDWNYMSEDILLFRKGKRTAMINGCGTTHNYFVISSPQSNFNGEKAKIHVAQFPIELPKKIISRTPGETTLDPFMGSGTTLRAAKDLQRKAIGVEIEEKYCEIAAKRLSQEVLPL